MAEFKHFGLQQVTFDLVVFCWAADWRRPVRPPNRSISFFYMAYFSKPQSAAVKITKPTNNDDPVKQPQPRKGQERIALVFVGPPCLANFACALDSVQRQCRNIVIYGLVHVLFI